MDEKMRELLVVAEVCYLNLKSFEKMFKAHVKSAKRGEIWKASEVRTLGKLKRALSRLENEMIGF